MLAQLEKSKLEITAAIEENKGIVDLYVANADIAIKTSDLTARVGGQIVASALGAINTQISTSYGLSNSHNWSY